jgi:hypothetical protein
MKANLKKWLYGLGSAVIGGGSGAVVSGVTAMGFAPDKFNLSEMHGVWRLLGLMFVNFLVSGILSMFFYLKQSPLPPETFETDVVTNKDLFGGVQPSTQENKKP